MGIIMKKSLIGNTLSFFVVAVLAAVFISSSGCGKKYGDVEISKLSIDKSQGSKNTSGTITLSVGLISEDLDFFQARIQEDTFNDMLPNILIDFKQYKNTEEMIKNQKIWQAANELPDVIYMKPDHILEMKSSLIPWEEDEELVKQNKFVKALKVNCSDGGGFYGLPMKVYSEWVYYRKSVFKELGLGIPESWNDFIDLAMAVKADGRYIPLAMGVKDTWPCYPFNEFMPHIVSNNANILSEIANQDEPFSPGSAFYKAYTMVDELYRADVFGNPLGTSWPESEQLIATKKAAMLVAGQYFLPDYKSFGGDMNDIDVFPLPIINDKSEAIKSIVMIDLFLGVNRNSKHIDLAKKYVEWIFNPKVYKAYIDERYMTSTIFGVDSSNIFTEAKKTQNIDPFMYVPGDGNYTKLVSETKWETKTIGAMMLAGKDYKAILADYNKKWKDARSKLCIN